LNHLVVVPVALPALIGAVQLLVARRLPGVQRPLGLATTAALVAVAVVHVAEAAEGDIAVYALGRWLPPLGIALVRDRLAALLLLLTSLVALASLLYATRGWDRRGTNFHGLFMFQLVGVNGAFLTGDLFNLFVFFEVLLIASFGLLLHGGGRDRLRAGVVYVAMNLAGSGLFLTTTGLLYGATGTLNLAQLGSVMADLEPGAAALAHAGAGLLLVVFALKAAIVPLHLWLPDGYAAAAAPVAALFAIMTKVGIYAILRVSTVVFGAAAGPLEGAMQPWLAPAALATLWVGMLGAVACGGLRALTSWLLVASVGTILLAAAPAEVPSLGAGLYYLVHSVLVAAGLFLLAEPIAEQRGHVADRLEPGSPLAQPLVLGWAFFAAAVAFVGLPPLSGFVGKTMILESVAGGAGAGWIYATVLGSALFGLIGCSRAGAVVFWRRTEAPAGPPTPLPALLPALALLSSSLLLTLAAGPVVGFTLATAEQVLAPAAYIDAVLGYGVEGEP
jgi:multicomponent K+:H+ antiporter subunit D